MGPSEYFQLLLREVKGNEEPLWLWQHVEIWEVCQRFRGVGRSFDQTINGKSMGGGQTAIPSDATYASNTQCKHRYVQISCLSVHSDGTSLVLRTAEMASDASSFVITSPNGQVTMVVSTGISLSATIL